MIEKVYLIVNPRKDPDGVNAEQLRKLLDLNEIEYIEPVSDGNISISDAASCDAIFTVGGDGTLIRAARELRSLDIPFFPINIGTLGYLTEATMDNAGEALQRLKKGDYQIQERMRLAGTMPDGEVITALNDVVLMRTGDLHILSFTLYINGRIVHTYSADGLIVATSTGSTGYNLSAGGAILEPEAQMMIVTPICPHTVRMTSLVVSGTDDLTIKVRETIDPDAQVAAAFDGGRMIPVEAGESVTIRKADEKTKLIRYGDDSFLDILYKKMKEH